MPVLEPSLGLLAGLFVLAAVVLQAGFFRVACFFLFTCILTVALGFAATYAVALRQPTSAPSLPRKLKFATPAAFESLKLRYQWECELPITRNALLSSLPEAVNARIDRFLSLILQHYIIAWFKPLTSTRAPRAFPRAVEDTIRFSITALLTRATTLDWPTILVSEVLPQVTSHVSHFKEAGGVTATSQDAEADIIMSKKYASLLPGGKLHPAVDVASSNTRPAEERYLRQVFSRILPILLPHEESTSSAVAVIVREVLASTVCVPLVDTLSEPDFWNQMIENKVSAALRERQQVAALRAALDSTPQPSLSFATQNTSQDRSIPVEISASTSSKDFDSFLRSITRCGSLVEARRLRTDITMALRKAQRDGKSDQASDRQAFHVKRLDAALSKIDDRITTLGGSISSEDPQALYKEEQASASLESLLRDAIGLSYWMEFMERRRRTPLVQFWLTVDGLRDPLDDNSDQSAPEVGQAAKEDAELLLMTFFNDNGPVATACSPKLVDVLRKFVKDPVTRNSDAKQLRTVIHALQGEAVEEMESRDYPAFKDSDLFVKMPITLLSGYPRRENISHSTSELAETSTSTAPTLSTLTGVTANATPSYPTLFNPARLLASRRSDTAPPQVDASEAVVDSPRANSPSFPSTPRSQPSSGLTHSASSFAFLMGLGEDEANRAPLFTTGPLTPSADILNPYEEDDRAQAQTMRAIQDALTSIVEQPTHTQSPALQPQASERGQASSELQRAISDAHATPSKTQSAPLSDLRRHVSAPSTKRRDRFFENEEPAQERSNSFASVLRSDSPSQESPSKELDERPLAADQIRDRVKHLSEQDDLVTSLLRRAEHTRNSRELKVLLRSLEAVRGERRMLELRLLGESNSPVSGHASRIQISSTSTGGPEGKEFVLYIVSVHQEAGPGESATGWMIARRYSEFFDLHVAVKEKFPTARHFEFPSKRLVTSMSPALVEQRRGALERYLQALLQVPSIAASDELQSFLSRSITLPHLSGQGDDTTLPGHAFFRNIYQSLAVGMDELTAGPTLFESMAQKLAQHASEISGLGLSISQQEALIRSAFMGTPNPSSVGQHVPQPGDQEGVTHFTAPICDTFVELFHLKDRSQWLRRQTILIVLQQVLGGTIERKLREAFAVAHNEESLAAMLDHLTETLFPNGLARSSVASRNAQAKEATRNQAHRYLASFLPEVAANLTGRQSARRAAQTIFTVLQNKRLLKHLIYTTIDIVLVKVLPEECSKNR